MLGNFSAGARAKNAPEIQGRWVYDARAAGGCVRLDSPAWFAWLEAPSTTRFRYPLEDRQRGYVVGVVTVRKERRQRGTGYWVAYRRRAGQLHKVYLGRSPLLTSVRLWTLGQQFLGKEVITAELESM